MPKTKMTQTSKYFKSMTQFQALKTDDFTWSQKKMKNMVIEIDIMKCKRIWLQNKIDLSSKKFLSKKWRLDQLKKNQMKVPATDNEILKKWAQARIAEILKNQFYKLIKV